MEHTTSRDQDEGAAFYRTLGRAIQVMRTERGLARKDLASRAGISYPYLSEIETGAKQLSSKVLLLIARALGARPHELLMLAEALPARDGVDGQDPTPVERSSNPASAVREPASTIDSHASRFFHARPAALSEGAEVLESPIGRTVRSQPARPVPKILRELQQYLERMSSNDVERILDLARRLSSDAERRTRN
jgi:transcriptional regulator with XRE-family HTH domain